MKLRAQNWLALVALTLLGCGGNGGLLIVTIDAASTITTQTIGLDVTAGGKMRHFDIPVSAGTLPPALQAKVELPPSALGTITLTASVGNVSATGSVNLAAGKTEALTLTLGATTSPDLLGSDAQPGADLLQPDGAPPDLAPGPDGASPDLTDSDQAPANVDLIVPAAALTADPPSVSFSKIARNTRTAGLKVKITNDGNAATAALSITVPSPFFKENDLCTGQTLAALGGNCTVDFYFQPTAVGVAGGSATVTDLGAASVSIPLSGEGVEPSQLTSTPASGSASWANILVSQSGPKITFAIKNTGGVATNTLAVAITSASDRPTDKDQFIKGADGCNGMTLTELNGAKDNCSIEITYTPAGRGSHLAAIEVQESGGGLLIVSLSGNALAPPTITIEPTTTSDFGVVALGKTSKRSFIIGNTGDVLASSGSMAYTFLPAGTSPFSVTSNGCTSGVPAGGSCTLELTYAPTIVGLDNTHSLKAKYTGSTTMSEDTEPLSGTGITAAVLTWTTPNPQAFPDTQKNMTSSKTLTLTNSGDEVATAIVVSESDAHYAVPPGTNNCDEGVTLAKNQSCTVVVDFTPISTGTKNANLSGDSAETTPTTFAMTGLAYDCIDADGDGRFTDAHCGGPVDCSDSDTDNWDQCGTCADADGDTFFTGCNRYVTRHSECDVNKNDATRAIVPETLGDPVDSDCNGIDLIVEDAQGIFVDQVLGLDANQGTKLAPVQTLGRAMFLAVGARRAIFLTEGTHNGPIVLTPPVPGQPRILSFYGGFESDWTRTGGLTKIVAATGNAITITGNPVGTKTPNVGVILDKVEVGATTGDAMQLDKAWGFVTLGSVIGQGRGIQAKNDSRVVVDGAVVQAVDTALLIQSGSQVLVRDAVVQGDATQLPINSFAITVQGASFLGIEDSTIQAGPCQGTGVALSITDTAFVTATSSTTRTKFVGSSTANFGFTIWQEGGTFTATGVEISGGSSQNPIGMIVEGSGTARLRSSVVVAGSALSGGTPVGLQVDSSVPPLLLNNLIDGGTGGFNAHALVVKNAGTPSSGTLQLVNNILRAFGSTGSPLRVEAGNGKIRVFNNALTGGNPGCRISAPLGGTPGCRGTNSTDWDRASPTNLANVDDDCQIGTDYHLPGGSSCVGLGANIETDGSAQGYENQVFVDLDGTNRPQGSGWEIGPDEL